MPTRAKTTITPDVSYLVDGEKADAADVKIPLNQTRDYVREGGVAVSDNDTHTKPLDTAISAGTGISKTITSASADERLALAVDETKVATDDNTLSMSNKTLATPTIADFSNATHDHSNAANGGVIAAGAIGSGVLAHERGGLEADVSAYGGLLKIAAGATSQAAAGTDYTSPAGTETLTNKTLDNTNKIAVDAIDPDNNAGASINDVIAWNGANYAPAAIGGGGAQPIDLTVTAGEALAERDRVYIDESDGKAYQVDTDATPIEIGRIRGVVNNSGGISLSASGTIRIFGEVSGFTGLTAWTPVYSSTTAGGYTQTEPDITAGSGQIAVDRIGYATSTTKVLVVPGVIRYLKRESLANNAEATIIHHVDPRMRRRQVSAKASSTAAGNAVAEYADTNQDTDKNLRSLVYGSDTLTGGTVSASSTNGTYPVAQAVDDNTSLGWISGGDVPQWLKYDYGVGNSATPRRVTIRAAVVDLSHSMNTFTIEGSNDDSAWDTLDTISGETGWSGGEQRTFDFTNSTAYRYVRLNVTANDGSTRVSTAEWEVIEATTGADKLTQTFQLSSTTDVVKARLYLKKVGSPTGTMTLRVETTAAGDPTGTLVDANATITLAESGLTTSYAWYDFEFPAAFELTGSTTYALVLSTDRTAGADYVSWGADGSTPSYASGEMLSEAAATWGSESADAVFEVYEVGTTFDEPCVVGRYSGGTRDIGVKFLDGSDLNGDTNTTFKNVSGGTLDVTCEVLLEG